MAQKGPSGDVSAALGLALGRGTGPPPRHRPLGPEQEERRLPHPTRPPHTHTIQCHGGWRTLPSRKHVLPERGPAAPGRFIRGGGGPQLRALCLKLLLAGPACLLYPGGWQG